MAGHSSRMQQHLADLKMLADLLGGIADRLPRRTEVELHDQQALATMAVALPELAAACDALFETLSEESADVIAQTLERREVATARRRMSS